MDRSLIATIYHGNDLEELISGRNILLLERPGGEKSTVAIRPGAKRLWSESSWGQNDTSGGNDLGRKNSDFRRQDSNMS